MEIKQELKFLINYKDFLEKNIISMEFKLEEYKKEFDDLEKYIRNNCKHDIIIDNIDSMTNYKLSDTIKYCNNCKLTFQ